jgi:hypothetical protein
MTPAERAAVRARAVELIQHPKPRRLYIALAAFLVGLLMGAAIQ